MVERRNTIPILANVMIAVREGKLQLTATDMEIAIVEDVAASTTFATGHAPRRPRRFTKLSAGCRTEPRSNWIIPAGTLSWRCGQAGMPYEFGGASGRGFSGDDGGVVAAPVQSFRSGAARGDRSDSVRDQH